MCGSMVDIHSPTAEIRRGKKKVVVVIVVVVVEMNMIWHYRTAVAGPDHRTVSTKSVCNSQ